MVCEVGFHRHKRRRRRAPQGKPAPLPSPARKKTIDSNGPSNGSGPGRYPSPSRGNLICTEFTRLYIYINELLKLIICVNHNFIIFIIHRP